MSVQIPERLSLCRRRLLAGLISLVALGGAQAQEADRPSLRVSGFGSLGLAHVDAPDGWGFRRELTQGGSDASWRADVDTRLGVQANYSLGRQFELVAQGIAKKRGAYARDSDALEWAYASYRPNADWTLRAGRVNLDAFLMADYRNVGYGFMTARPPIELYGMLPTALDGADVARSWLHGDAQWRAKLMLGKAGIGDYDSSKPGSTRDVLGLMLSREEGGLLVRASVARTRIHIDLSDQRQAMEALAQLSSLPVPSVASQAQVLRDRMGEQPTKAVFYELGLRHELADWQWSAEYVRVAGDPIIKQSSLSVVAGRRLGDWTPYVGYSRSRDAMPVVAPPQWQAVLAAIIGPVGAAQAQFLGDAITGAVNVSRVRQSGWSIGARWDFHPQAALKLQWDESRIEAFGSGLWTHADGGAARARVATAVVDFIF
jgi:hypothetical protein